MLLLCVLLTAGVGGAQESGTYTNPVSKTFANTFADPAVIKGKDGYWCAYGTSDPLLEGEGTFHTIPIARSRDLINWQHVDDAFSPFFYTSIQRAFPECFVTGSHSSSSRVE